MQYVLDQLPYPDKNENVVKSADPLIVKGTKHIINRTDNVLDASIHPDMRKG